MFYIYILKNLKNNKVYIGSTNNINRRFYNHLKDLRTNKHYNKHLQHSWNKYGEENFIFETLDSRSFNIEELENEYIVKYKSNNYTFGYNLAIPGKRRLYKYSKESIEKQKRKLFKKVYQFNFKNELVRIYNSIKDVEEYGFCKENVSACVRGKQKTHKNYIWSFKNIKQDLLQRKANHRQLLEINECGKIVNIYPRISEYIKINNTTPGKVKYAIYNNKLINGNHLIYNK